VDEPTPDTATPETVPGPLGEPALDTTPPAEPTVGKLWEDQPSESSGPVYSGPEAAEPSQPARTLPADAGRPIGPATVRYGTPPPDAPLERVPGRQYPDLTGRTYLPAAPRLTTRPTPAAPERRGVQLGTVAVVGLLAGIAGAALTAIALLGSDAFQATDTTVAAPVVNATVVAPPPTEALPPIRTEIVTPAGDPPTAAAVGVKVLPSIVTVEIGGNDSSGDFVIAASGSGVVLTADGLVVTNHHVIEDAAQTQVVFLDGRIFEAEIVGSDPVTDLAVLRIEGDSLVPIDRGSSDALVIGDTAIAVGSPLGLSGGPSLTAGVVSALDREVIVSSDANGILYGMLQTDAPITRGSSGGALVDQQGRLIGITTAIGVSDAGAEGIGFAIPVELVTRVTDEIVEKGEVRHAFLGVLLEDVFVTEGPLQTPAGAAISQFVDDSAAEAAGLHVGDQIIGFEGNPVDTKEDIIIKLRRYRVGEPVHFIVIRDGATLEFDVVLGERPADL